MALTPVDVTVHEPGTAATGEVKSADGDRIWTTGKVNLYLFGRFPRDGNTEPSDGPAAAVDEKR
jgi:hypothetical protein